MSDQHHHSEPADWAGAQDRHSLPEIGRIWGLPGVASDPTRPDVGVLPVLTVVSSVSAYTGDPGAEPVDMLLSGLLGYGFSLLTGLSVAELADLPVLPGWSVHCDGGALDIAEPGGSFYVGDLGPAVPPSWRPALATRGLLAVLVCPGRVDLFCADRDSQLRQAQRHGEVVAAQVQLQRAGQGHS